MTSNWSLTFLFTMEVVLTSITEAVAQNTLPKKQSEPRGEWGEETEEREVEGLLIPSWLIGIVLPDRCHWVCCRFCRR